MQIVIDIDEEVLKTRKYTDYFGCGSIKLTGVLDNAIPLPKGHGRLIDADELWDLYHSNDYDFYEALDSVDTIIEADKESEDKE